MKNIYTSPKGKFVEFLKVAVIVLVLVGCGVKGWGQTNNYFGTTGTLSGNVWSTAVGGPYTSPLNTTGGAIINFGNTTTAITGGTITVAGINATANATITTAGGTISNFSNGIVPVDVSGGITLDLNGQAITTSATAGYIKNGSGVFATTGATYGGGFTLNSGTFIIRGTNALGTGISTFNGGVLAANGNRTIASSSINMGGDLQIGEIPANVLLASNTANIIFPAVSLGGTTRIFTFGNAAAYTISGVISGTGGITFASNANGTAGNMTVSGTNTYSGPTTINGGTLIIGAINNGGANGRLGASSIAANNLVLGGGTLSYTGATSSTDRNFTLTNGTTSTINVSTAATVLTLTGAAATSNGSLTKSGSGTLQLNGSNAYTGTTAIIAGTLRIGAAERIDNSSALTLSGGTFGLNSFNETVGSLAGSGGTVDTQGGGTPLFTAGGDNSTTSFAGAISNGTGTVSFTKEGTGTLTLTGANTYTGTTTINAGTLQLSRAGGALVNTQNVNVNSTGTLRITNNQTLANINLASGATLTVDPGVTLNITGTLTVNTGATISATGTITYAGVGALVYNGTTTFTAGIEWPTASVPVSVNIVSTATVVLSNDVTTTTSLIVDGVLNAKTFQITGTGPLVNINGTLITERLQGFTGSGTTFTGISPTLGVSSTVEYAAPSGSQIITTSPLYVNLTLSSGGTKTAANALSISNNLTISGNTVFDAGNSSIGGLGTNVIMTGTSRYIQSGTGTKPDARGTYTLAPTSTIEFSNNAGTQQDTRLTPDVGSVTYANVDISGSNVGLSGATSVLNMQAGTTFTVTSTGTFNVKNTNGFSGTATTAINNTNNPTIALVTGSTINYDGAAQTITNTQAYQNLTLSGSGSKTAPATNLLINGNFSRAGTCTFNPNASRVVFQGTAAQTFSDVTGLTPIDFYNVSNTNTINLIVNSAFGILNELNLSSSAKLNLNTGDIHMRSSATRTAYITDLGTNTTYTNITYGTGRFSIERYLRAFKSWRFLATPIIGGVGTATINDSWREAGTTLTANGYGTRVTGPGTIAFPGGVDEYTLRGSMKSYSMALNNYVEVTSADLAANKTIANDEGYYVFVRGDRGVDVNGAAGTTNLRMRGQIRTSNQTFSVNAGAFQSVGNPFASQIDFRNVSNASIAEAFTIWNPSSAGSYNVGAYETYVKDLNPPNDFKLNGTGAILNTIESGQAFFIQSSSAGSITIKESDKTTGSALVSRENEQGRPGVTIPTLEINIHTNDINGVDYIADAAMINFNNSYSSDLDNLDVKKITNAVDNLVIKYGTINLVAERRPNLVITDTIRLGLTNTRIAPYRFEIDPSVLGNLQLAAFLKDKFLQTETPVSLTAVTNYNFNITADAGSRVADRFMIVFRQPVAGPLPVRFIDIAATRNADKTNAVKWTVANEINMQQYEIERSDKGTNFVSIGTASPLNNTGGNYTYNFVDAAPLAQDNYYRIKAISTNGQIQYSAIVKILADVKEPFIAVIPNPVENKTIQLQMGNQAKGLYNVQLINSAGQTVYRSSITVNNYMQTNSIELDRNTATGNYQLLILSANGDKTVKQIMVQ